jgi:hypothetical protein
MLNDFFFYENRTVYEIMPKNVVEPEGPQSIRRMRVACWIRKAARAQAHPCPPTFERAHMHKYVVLITFPRQQLLRERAPVWRYTYIVCLVRYCLDISLEELWKIW